MRDRVERLSLLPTSGTRPCSLAGIRIRSDRLNYSISQSSYNLHCSRHVITLAGGFEISVPEMAVFHCHLPTQNVGLNT